MAGVAPDASAPTTRQGGQMFTPAPDRQARPMPWNTAGRTSFGRNSTMVETIHGRDRPDD